MSASIYCTYLQYDHQTNIGDSETLVISSKVDFIIFPVQYWTEKYGAESSRLFFLKIVWLIWNWDNLVTMMVLVKIYKFVLSIVVFRFTAYQRSFWYMYLWYFLRWLFQVRKNKRFNAKSCCIQQKCYRLKRWNYQLHVNYLDDMSNDPAMITKKTDQTSQMTEGASSTPH